MLIRQCLQRIALLTAFLLSACNLDRNRVTGPNGVRITQVSVAPDTVMVDPSERFQFQVFGRTTAGDTVPVSVAWTATAGTITQAGLYTADTSENDVDVTASLTTAEPSGILTGTARVRKRRVVAILLTPASVTLLAASTKQFDAVGLRNAGDTVPVAVSYSATGGAITNGGLLTAGSAAGTYRVIATRPQGPLADTSVVTISTVPVASVTVTPASAGVAIGGTVQLAAAARDAAGNVLNGRSISWTSTAPAVATVSATGLVGGVAVGNATITATSEGQSGTATVSVTLAPVASVTVNPSSASVLVGATVQLSATLKDANGNTLVGRAITWASGNPAVATVTADGGLAAGMGSGTATITATSESKNGTTTITVSVPPPPGTHVGYYVAPGGSSANDGSASRPWDLATALAGGGGRVAPGDTIWLRGGTYRGPVRSRVSGVAGAPVVIRQYPGERAIIDGAGSTSSTFVVDGSYSIFWGFELTNTDPDRTDLNRPDMVVNHGPHNKYINLIVHDGNVAYYTYTDQPDVEIYGSIIYNIGWQGTDRGHGHAIYAKNDVGPLVLRDNVMFNQFGYGVHGYTNAGSGHLINIRIEGNVSFNNGSLSNNSTASNIMVAGNEVADQIVVKDNFTYFSPSVGGSSLRMGRGSLLDGSMRIEGNYLAGGSPVMDVGDWRQAVVAGNTFIGTGNMVVLQDPNTSQHAWSGDLFYRDPSANAWRYSGTYYTFSAWQTATGLAAGDQARSGAPATQVFVRPNAYEPGRAHIIVYNWGRLSMVAADLAGVLRVGERFEVRNVQDLFGTPVVSGVYTGGAVSLAMTGATPPAPIGMAASRSPVTGPEFDVFLVTRVP